MHIIINVALLPDIYPDEYISFLSQVLRRIAANHSEHRFTFICETGTADLFAFGINNTEVIKTKSRKANTIAWKYWYDIKLPALLKKRKADLFMSVGYLGSYNIKIPQCLLVNDLSFLHFPSLFTKAQLRFIKSYSKKSIEKAKQVMTFTQFAATEIQNHYTINDNKITVVTPGMQQNSVTPSEEIKFTTRQKYSSGKEFFLYAGATSAPVNLVNLLKAFSLFKKRQQSSFKLVICGKTIDKQLIQSLQTYKYKDDVSIINNSTGQELYNIISSAYAFVYPVFSAGFPLFVLQAMQAKVPVISSADSAAQEITGGVALYVNAENPQDIADSMMRIYKDERLRNELIEKGKSVIGNYKENETAEELWRVMEMAVE